MKKNKIKRKIFYIDYECKIGQRVHWKNMKDEYFEGVIKQWNDNIAIVVMDDGTEKTIEC